MTTPAQLYSYVDGSWQGGAATFDDLNPAHPSEVVAEVHAADATLAADAILAARGAFPAWRDTPVAERVAALSSAAGITGGAGEELAPLLVREHGGVLWEAQTDDHAIRLLK